MLSIPSEPLAQDQGVPQLCGGLYAKPAAPNPIICNKPVKSSRTHVANLEVLPHEEVQGGTGVGPDGVDAAAAVPQEPQAQVCTLLCLLLKQQLRELENSRGGNVLGQAGMSTQTNRQQ